jgi:hypothetical protein
MSRNRLAAAAALVLLVVLAYAPALRAGFILDDDLYVSDNPHLATLAGLGRLWVPATVRLNYYPLVFTSFWLEYRAWGLNAAGYHVTNVLLHAANAVLLWLALRRLGVPGAWLAAALFGLHPVHVESVAWVSERKNVLSGLFYGLALLAYLRFAPPEPDRAAPAGRRRWYALALVFFLCALFSKTVTCSLPAVLLLVLWWKRGRVGARDVLALAPLFVLGVLLSAQTAWQEETKGARVDEWSLSLIQRGLLAGRALWFYAGKLAWPRPLVFFYPGWRLDPSEGWQYLYPAAAAGTLLALWRQRGRLGRGPVVAALFFAGSLVPALGLFNVRFMALALVADHFQYLASIGLLVPAAAGVAALGRLPAPGRAAALAVAVLLLATLGWRTWRQCQTYRTPEVFYTNVLRQNPAAWLAYYNRGLDRLGQGRLDEAAADSAAAARLRPSFGWAEYHWGLALYCQCRWAEARPHFQAALTADARLAYPHYCLAMLGTRDHLHAGLALLAPAPLNVAPVGLLQVTATETRRQFDETLRKAPDFPDTYFELGKFLLCLGERSQAVAYLEQALRLRPDDVGYRAALEAGRR